jgi:ClpP class serine protease
MINYDILALAPGSEAKFLDAELAIEAKIMTLTTAEARGSTVDEDDEQSRLLQMAGNVGIISVSGGLTNKYSFWNRLFGMTAYDEIREASIQALDMGAETALYNWDTPGGRVSGMADCANFIDTMPIPTVSFSAGGMASAGYFLGCQSDHIFCDSFAEVGSIGVIVKMYDKSKMLADRGVKPIKFASGTFKGVGDGDFKPTAQEKAHIQAKVDKFAGMFFDIVADARGLTLPVMAKLGITSGQTFIGAEAVTAQLVDAQKTFDESMMKAYDLAEKAIDKKEKSRVSYV